MNILIYPALFKAFSFLRVGVNIYLFIFHLNYIYYIDK